MFKTFLVYARFLQLVFKRLQCVLLELFEKVNWELSVRKLPNPKYRWLLICKLEIP